MTRERRPPGETTSVEESEALRALVQAQRAYDEALHAWLEAHPDGMGLPRAAAAWEKADPALRKAAEELTLAGRQLRNVRGRRHGHGPHEEE